MQKARKTEERLNPDIEEKVKLLVDESVKFAEESLFPDPSEIYKDVYVQEDYPYIKD